MHRLRSDRARWALVVAVALAALVVVQVAWLLATRQHYPLIIDEAGYMAIALHQHAALVHDGIGAFWDAVQGQAPHAPLVPAITALIYTVHAGILISFAAVLGFMVLLVGAIYAIAERLMTPRAAALAALVTATLPGVLQFSRVYIFAIPVAALLAVSVYALLRSSALTSTKWSLALGVAAGLMLLTRTMALAFIPGLAVAAGLAALRHDRGDRRRAAINGTLALAACLGLAALWYLPNLNAVVDYLTGYGYGDQSRDYGQGTSVFAASRWSAVAEKAGAESVHLPSALVLLAGLACAATVAARRVRGQDRVPIAVLLRSDWSLLAIVAGCGYLALSTSTNGGFGFALPLVPLLVLLAIGGFRRVPQVRAAATAALIAVAVLNLGVAFEIPKGLARVHQTSIPLLHAIPITDGRPFALTSLRQQEAGPQLDFVPRERRWAASDRAIAAFALDYAHARGAGPIMAFAPRHRVLNTNTVGLAGELWYGQSIPQAQLTVYHGGDRTAAYARYLSDPKFGWPNILVTSSSEAGDYTPHVTQARAEAAARKLGFKPVWKTRLPDGRVFRLWWLKR